MTGAFFPARKALRLRLEFAPRLTTRFDSDMDTPVPKPSAQSAHNANTGPDANQPRPAEKEHHYPVEFRGRGSEYFKIWIVNVLLSIITLYVYSAWAKVRNKRYFYGNTFVDNSSFEYHALGGQIFTGRVVAILILFAVSIAGVFFPLAQIIFYVLLLLLIPWIIWRSIIFNARMTSYRNVRYGFTKRVGGLYWAMFKCLLIPLLILLALEFVILLVVVLKNGGFDGLFDGVTRESMITGMAGSILGSLFLVFILVIPWLHRNLSHFALNGYRFGTAKFSSTLSTAKYYLIYIGSILVALGLYILFALPFIIAALVFKDGVPGLGTLDQIQGNLEDALQPDSPYFLLVVALAVLFYLLILFISLVSAAYLRGKLRNYRYQQTVAGNRVSVKSTVRTWPFAWLLFTNLLLLAMTLGLAFAWTRVRLAKYLAANTVVTCKGTLDGFISAEEERISSLGDELGEAFDFDFELGL